MRSAIHALSLALFGDGLPIACFPRQPRYRGLGLSDWDGYARRLKGVLRYTNTFFDRRPYLDITNIPPREDLQNDFVVSIDVFEHVPQPVENAFAGAAKLLRPGGKLILSVPYSLDGQTEEHYPELHRFVIKEIMGVQCLINRKRDGTLEIFDNLKFHGGIGRTLEMRQFCRDHVLKLLTDTGFEAPLIVDRAPEWGILYDNECSRTMVATKK
ncbi:MAG TPA: methyltransferase domain-containing protein [Bryobacteraceae bacterium]|jgi:SAM-dependent methyltransferase|nr:methyltransferase domain-containing protein [Bryobacteraceae bacterium]